jgi:hypothetical protein
VFRKAGIKTSDHGESPRRKHTTNRIFLAGLKNTIPNPFYEYNLIIRLLEVYEWLISATMYIKKFHPITGHEGPERG